jgi:hypothetical protein
MQTKINFIALVAGISSLLLIAISMFVPWWQFKVSDPANVQVSFSPVNFDISHSGTSIGIPLVFAINIACLLTLLASGIILTIYALKPSERYSKQLLGFGYKKPLIMVVAFVALLISMPMMMQSFAGFTLPINGSGTLSPPGSEGSANVSVALEWPFYFAIVVAGLCVAARLFHNKVAKPPVLTVPDPA